MRRSFFSKAIVAVGVMASAMALSSIAVFADEVVKSDLTAFTAAPSEGASITGTDTTYLSSSAGSGLSSNNGLKVPSNKAYNNLYVAESENSTDFLLSNKSLRLLANFTANKDGTLTADFSEIGTGKYVIIIDTSAKTISEKTAYVGTVKEGKATSISYPLVSGHTYALGSCDTQATFTYIKYEATASTDPNVTLSASPTTITVGNTATITPTPNSYFDSANATYSYESLDTDIATVSGNVVTGVSAGTATIKCTASDGKTTLYPTIDITVKDLAKVKGKVTDKNNNAVANISLTMGSYNATTDENGEYEILNVAEGKYTLQFAGNDNYDDIQQSVTVDGETIVNLVLDDKHMYNVTYSSKTHNIENAPDASGVVNYSVTFNLAAFNNSSTAIILRNSDSKDIAGMRINDTNGNVTMGKTNDTANQIQLPAAGTDTTVNFKVDYDNKTCTMSVNGNEVTKAIPIESGITNLKITKISFNAKNNTKYTISDIQVAAENTSNTISDAIKDATALTLENVTISYPSGDNVTDTLTAKYAENDTNAYLVIILSANQVKYDKLVLGTDTINEAYEKIIFGENDELTAEDAGGSALVAYVFDKPESPYTKISNVSATFSNND